MPELSEYDDKWFAAVRWALETEGKFVNVLMQWKPYPRPGLDRLIVKGAQIFYNPDLPTEVLAAELLHLSHHRIQKHQKRLLPSQYPNAKLRRIASCLETVIALDEDIQAAGLQWAPGTDLRSLYPLPRRMTAEEIYEYLDKTLSEEEKQENGQGEQQEGDQEMDGSSNEGSAQSDQSGNPSQPGQSGQSSQGSPSPGNGGGNSDAMTQPGNEQSSGTSQSPQPPKPEDVPDGICRLEDYDFSELDADGMGEGDGDGKDGDGEGKDQNGNGIKPGSQDADIQREVTAEGRRNMMWLKIRAKLMAGSGSHDFAMRPKQSPSSPPGMTLSKLQKKKERIGILLDVSGSVDQKMMQTFVEMVRTIHMRERDILIATGNTKVLEVGTITLLDRIHGMGGTALDKVIPQAWLRLRRPTRYLVITDGETEWPPTLPRNTVILVVNNRDVINLKDSYWSRNTLTPAVRRSIIWVRPQDLLAADIKRDMQKRYEPPTTDMDDLEIA